MVEGNSNFSSDSQQHEDFILPAEQEHSFSLPISVSETPKPEQSIEELRAEVETKRRGVRESITLLAKYKPEALERLGFITIVQRRENLPDPNMDCFEYVLGKEETNTRFVEIVQNLDQTLTPSEGDYAVYLSDDGKEQIHIGRVTDDRKVISKWGPGSNVYKSAPLDVPLNYGNNVIYFQHNNVDNPTNEIV